MDRAGKDVTKKKLMKVAEEESMLRLKCKENLHGVPKVSRSLMHYPRTPHNGVVSQVNPAMSTLKDILLLILLTTREHLDYLICTSLSAAPRTLPKMV